MFENEIIETLYESAVHNAYEYYVIMDKQKNKMIELIEDIHLYKDIYFIGLGYSRLAIEDFTGLFTYISEKHIYIIDNNFQNYWYYINNVDENSLVVVSAELFKNK